MMVQFEADEVNANVMYGIFQGEGRGWEWGGWRVTTNQRVSLVGMIKNVLESNSGDHCTTLQIH